VVTDIFFLPNTMFAATKILATSYHRTDICQILMLLLRFNFKSLFESLFEKIWWNSGLVHLVNGIVLPFSCSFRLRPRALHLSPACSKLFVSAPYAIGVLVPVFSAADDAGRHATGARTKAARPFLSALFLLTTTFLDSSVEQSG
jgi:hypothetical protein